MYLIFFLVWLIFNGQITTEIVLFGLVISAGIYFFICKFMNYRPRTDLLIMKRAGLFAFYFLVLLKEIVKANFAVVKLMTMEKYEIEPVIVRFKVDLKTKAAKAILADSITLTPGTITVSLEENEYQVHCLDRDLAEGIENSEFVTLLQKMEAMK